MSDFLVIEPQTINGEKVERQETIEFKVELNKEQFDKYSDELKELYQKALPIMHEGDTLKFTYFLNIYYVGKVADALKALLALSKEPDVFRSITDNELLHGECLFREVIKSLENLKLALSIRDFPIHTDISTWWMNQ